SFGNRYGVKLVDDFPLEELNRKAYGSVLLELETSHIADIGEAGTYIGQVNEDECITVGDVEITFDEMLDAWESPLESVFPTKTKAGTRNMSQPLYNGREFFICKNKVAVPKVFIPVFPGTNCEYDSEKAFRQAGAEVETIVFRNQSETD